MKRPQPTLPKPLPPRLATQAGFTLVELLVAAAVSSITVVTAMLILSPHLTANQRMEGYTRLQERWIRFNYLFDTEVQRASTVQTTADSVVLTIPLTLPSGAVQNQTVTYRLVAANGLFQLRRDGPQIYRSGDLTDSSSANAVQLVSNQTVLDGITPSGFTATVVPDSGNVSLDYSINLTDRNTDSTFRGKGSVARGRADCESIESEPIGNTSRGPCN